MSTRTLTVLAVAAALLVLLAVLAQRSGDPAPQTAEPLLPGLAEQLDGVERVTLVKAGGEPVATLVRGDTGWTVAERQGYPADFGKLRQALIALSEARTVERKTSNPTLYERIGVEDVAGDDASGVAISFTGEGVSLPTLIVGDAEGGSHRYVRRAGEEQSYLIDRNPDLPRDTAQWLDGRILDVSGPRVQQVTITHPDGEVVRVYKDESSQTNFNVADVPEGRELQYPGVANVIGNALRELNLEDVEAADGAATDTTTVELRTFDGLVVRAEGFERDDAAWMTFAASFDPEQAARFAPSSESSSSEDSGTDGEAEADADAAPAEDAAAAADTEAAPGPEEEAAAINARVAGWRYRIASYQYDQMTRRLDDLLRAPPAQDDEEE